MSEKTDVIILGVGTSGEDLALRLLRSGLRVVGIEAQLVGGECPYWACIPSKMMIRAANLLQAGRRVNGLAGYASVSPDWTQVAARVRAEATGDWNDSTAVKRFQDHGGQFVRGWGRMAGPDTVSVDGQTFVATRGIVIATGSKPAMPPIPGLAEVGVWTTHDLMQAKILPDSLIVLGGGAVGCELGQVCARFGVNVTIVEGRDRLLPLEEPEASAILTAALMAEGIQVRTGIPVERVKSNGAKIHVQFAEGDTLIADRVLVAAGRKVDVSALNLKAASVTTENGFVKVDDYLRAGERIWAMGDVTGKAMFTHVALYQAAIVAAGILNERAEPAEYRAVPRVTFTDPEIGAVGMSEADAKAAGRDIATVVKKVPATFRGWVHGPNNDGVIKLVVDRKTGALIGATAVGPNGGEVLGLLSAVVHAGLPLATLRRMIWAFPTFYGAIGEAIGGYARGLVGVLDPGAEPFVQP
jgi:pyruvate/2-oxoglutarate dehydrogenase complex dihydrolipoamide dehydrogenase (E3) component